MTVSVISTPEIATASRGTGLVLPIVKGRVDMHSGRIEVERSLAEGTRIAHRTVQQSGGRVA